MNKNTIALIRLIAITLILTFALTVVSFDLNRHSSTATALSKVGSRGNEVTSIQNALAKKGFYHGKIDGIYGNDTKKAVVAFQKSKKLPSDGICGTQTLKALGITAAAASTGKYTAAEIALLARTISAESRDEPYIGQVAVGAVILNRIKSPIFPHTISDVIYQPGAFSCLKDGQFNKPVADSSKKAAIDAINGMDPSGGALYYYNPKKTTNKWILSRPVIIKIGNHLFCSES
ncbi:MAG: spore cortex-lytic enzyme [Bacillota bacterium]|nr:spore cortex-lytic enzyme [Bacillota bacterium]